MLYELREYTVIPGKMPALVQRFLDHTFRLLDKQDVDVTFIAHTEFGSNSLGEIVYAVKWDSYQQMQDTWGRVLTDPEWAEVKAATESDGPMLTSVRRRMLNTAPFEART